MKTTTTKVPMIEFVLWNVVIVISAFILVLAMAERSPGAEEVRLCEPREKMEISGHDHHAKWHDGTLAQWQFLRGIYAMNPLTPPGLPMGDSVGWWTQDGEELAIAYFIDGDVACTPMQISKKLLELLDQVRGGEIPHEGKAL